MVRFKSIILEDIVPSKIEELDGKEEVKSYLKSIDVDFHKESINNKSIFILFREGYIIEFEGQFPVVYELKRFIREKSSSRHFYDFTGVDWRKHYTNEFWENVGTIPDYNKLYHATKEKYVDDILKNGLKAKNKTRIPTSKIRKNAVFAVLNPSMLQDEVYGGKVIIIDTLKMKNDGFTPLVGREKDWERQDRARYLQSKLNIYGQIERMVPAGEGGSGSWRDTIVIYDDIPPKYISLYK